MKPFPPEDDLQFLVGLEVGQVCLDPWSTQLRFSDGGQITLEGPFEHCDVRGALHAHQSNDTQDLGPLFLRDIIQQRITRLAAEGSQLVLWFGNGAVLKIFAEAGQYEDGHIDPLATKRGTIIF